MCTDRIHTHLCPLPPLHTHTRGSLTPPPPHPPDTHTWGVGVTKGGQELSGGRVTASVNINYMFHAQIWVCVWLVVGGEYNM